MLSRNLEAPPADQRSPLGHSASAILPWNIRKYVLIFSDTLTDLTDITWPSWHSGILAFDLAYLLPFDLTPIRWQILAVCELVMFGSGGARREPTWRGGRRTSYPLVNSHSYGKSPFFIGKPSINGPLSMAMLNLNNQRVYVSATWNGQFEDCPPYKTHRRRITPKLPWFSVVWSKVAGKSPRFDDDPSCQPPFFGSQFPLPFLILRR